MSPPPSISPVTGNPVPPHYIHASSLHFQDTHGRTLLLRGVNLSGSAKAPLDQPSWSQDGFWEQGESGKQNWTNSTLNLDDGSADIHLARLRAWGFNMLRYVFNWEALEHEGPGKYDYEYMDYVIKVLYKCKEYGFRVFMDPHQDVWSRFSGGSGAPLWTIYACAIDPYAIVPTYSALVHCDFPSVEEPKPKTFPAMIWSTNYTRLFSQTVWTLFFAGKTFAPNCIIDEVNIQDWLQSHYIDAVAELAKRIAATDDLFEECVIGWDSLNEPGEGLIGVADLSVIPSDQALKKGPSPTPFEGMRLGMGEAVEVPVWDFGPLGPSKNGTVVLDPKGIKLWLKPEDEVTRGGGKWGWSRGKQWEMGTCIWAQHGVWDPLSSTLLQPNYFATLPSDPSHHVEFVSDFWRIHWLSYASRIRLHHPEAIHFIQTSVFKQPPSLPESFLANRACSSAHYYDGLTLMTKHWNWFNADALGLLRHKYWSVVQAVKVGESAIRKSIQEQLGILQQDTKDCLGTYPTLIGEIGCPYDMDDKKAYGYVDGGRGEGDFSSQQKAWDCSLNATDGPNVLNFTLWTYVPHNSHEWGDNWNGEDLSIWSIDNTDRSTYQDNSSDAVVSSSHPLLPSSQSSSSTLFPSPIVTPKGIQSGQAVTAQLILDGARAVAAFCRPFPILTVGTPQRLDFDIKSSTFKLSVLVSPSDNTSNGISTEIYVPFVHYAETLEPDVDATSSTTVGSYLNASQQSSALSLLQVDRKDGQGLVSIESVNSGPLKLAVDVKISHGTFTTSGQSLSWFYPAPAVESVYTIEIRRRGGALVRPEESFVQQGGWADIMRLVAEMMRS